MALVGSCQSSVSPLISQCLEFKGDDAKCPQRSSLVYFCPFSRSTAPVSPTPNFWCQCPAPKTADKAKGSEPELLVPAGLCSENASLLWDTG